MKAHGQGAKLLEQCDILTSCIRSLRPAYVSASVLQKRLIETMVGAALWYLPQAAELWTGKISQAAILVWAEGKRPSKDHEFPRKVAAEKLLTNDDLTSEGLFELYRSSYGMFTFVTSAENKKLKTYQTAAVFVDPETCYRQAGVQLIDIVNLLRSQTGGEVTPAKVLPTMPKLVVALAKQLRGLTTREGTQAQAATTGE